MPSIRNMPKWLAFLVPLTLSLALLSAVGCSSDDDDKVVQPPIESKETGVANITISRGALEPAFREDVRNYGVTTFYTTPPDFQITVAVKDPKSKLFINGQERNSGQVTSVALNREGDTTIPIQVIAEDGKNFNVVNVTTKTMPLNTRVYIYDAVAGNRLSGAKISLRDARTNELLAAGIDFPDSAQGTVFLGLDKNRRYNIYASRDDTGMACFADFDHAREADASGIATVALYSRRDWIKDLPKGAPIITEVLFGNVAASGQFADANWKNAVLDGANYFEEVRENMQWMAITAIAESQIGMTGNAGSINANFNAMPFQNTSLPPMTSYSNDTKIAPTNAWMYLNDPVVINGKRYFRTRLFFSLTAANAPLASGPGYLDIVVYDWANNRTEQKVYLNITSAPGTGTTAETDFSNTTAASWFTVQGLAYGMAQNDYGLYSTDDPPGPGDIALMAADTAGPLGDTVYTRLELDFVVGYRGWELYRSESVNGPWDASTKIRERKYTTPTGTYYFTTTDTDPALVGGATYYYRYRIYNNICEYWTNILTIPTLPSFNTSLVLPAHYAVVDTVWPTFSFKLSNPAILDMAYHPLFMNGATPRDDYGRFILYVRDKEGIEVLKARFEINYGLVVDGKPTIRINWPYGGAWLDISQKPDGTPVTPFVTIGDDGTITINTKLANDNFSDQFTMFALYPSESYEWNIFGDQGSAASNWSASDAYSMYFTKNLVGYQQPGVTIPASSYTRSYGSTQNEGSGAINGYFTLTISPSAN